LNALVDNLFEGHEAQKFWLEPEVPALVDIESEAGAQEKFQTFEYAVRGLRYGFRRPRPAMFVYKLAII